MKRILSLLGAYALSLIFVGFAYSADQTYNLSVEIVYNDETPSDASRIAKKIMEDNGDADQMKVVSNLLTERGNRVDIIEVRANLKFTYLTPQRAAEISRKLAEDHGEACVVEIKWEMVNDPALWTLSGTTLQMGNGYFLRYDSSSGEWSTVPADANDTTN
jgi:hypothetical protein